MGGKSFCMWGVIVIAGACSQWIVLFRLFRDEVGNVVLKVRANTSDSISDFW